MKEICIETRAERLSQSQCPVITEKRGAEVEADLRL